MTQPRNFPNWLEAWVSLFTETEVPITYAIWTGVWTISSVLKNNVGIARGSGLLHPNVYIILVGPGASGKSYCSEVSTRLLDGLGFINLYKGRMSESYMIKYLSALTQLQTVVNPTSTSISPVLSIYSDELAMTVGSGDQSVEFLRLMTLLYTSGFDYGTHAHGLIKIDHPIINWLALATVSWLKRSLPRDLIDSGFVARVITQKEDLSKKIVAQLPKIDKDKLIKLQADLLAISTLSIEYELSPEAREIHSKWYTAHRTQRQETTDAVTQNIYGREDEHSYKVAMCLKASGGDDHIIRPLELRNAIKLVEDARNSNINLFRSLAVGEKTLELKDYIRSKIPANNEFISHEHLMRKVGSVIPERRTAKEIIAMLMEEGIIEAIKGQNGSTNYREKNNGTAAN